jgi:hypothetical protein
MKSLRDSLPDGFLSQMEKHLGREEMLRLLWPLVVGPSLGASTRLVGIRGSRLRIAVPDQTWKRELSALERTVIDAIHRACGGEFVRYIDLVEDLTLAARQPTIDTARRRLPPAIPRLNSPAPLAVDDIADEGLRLAFQQSAQKYFAWQAGTRD